MFGYMYGWWFWGILMLVFLVPVGYGWGYRGWGMPYPSYVQRRRMERSGSVQGGFDHQAWGRGGDFVWALMLFEIFFVAFLFWRR